MRFEVEGVGKFYGEQKKKKTLSLKTVKGFDACKTIKFGSFSLNSYKVLYFKFTIK